LSLENISTVNILKGMKKSYNNACLLIEEAEILSAKNKWQRGYALCQLAIEEFAKLPILFNLWIDRINSSEIDYKELNDFFKNHIKKTKISIESEITFYKMYKEHSGEKWVDNAIKNGEELITKISESNELKNKSLYVSIKGNDFQSPDEIIDEEEFDSIYSKAILRQLMIKSLLIGAENNIAEIARLVKEKEYKFYNKSS
jgi:AbiV family abortive infection protein